MDLITSYPIIPILTFVIIAGVVGYLFYQFFQERKKNRIPKVPKITAQKHYQNATSLDKQIKPNMAKTKQGIAPKQLKTALLVTLIVFVIINVIVVSYFLQKRRITYLPRANPVPTVSPTEKPTKTPSPTTNPEEESINSADELEISPTDIPASPTLVAKKQRAVEDQPVPTQTEEVVVSPTETEEPGVSPTKLPAQGGQSASPTPKLISQYTYTEEEITPSLTPANTPTPKPTATATPTVSPAPTTTIPKAGLSAFSLILLFTSLVLLGVGLVL